MTQERQRPPGEGGRDRRSTTIRPLWATALYAGLRRGELMALDWERIELAGGLIDLRFGWDMHEGLIELKSRAGRRRVPIIPALRDRLIDQRLLTGRDSGFVFGREADLVSTSMNITGETYFQNDRWRIYWRTARSDRHPLALEAVAVESSLR